MSKYYDEALIPAELRRNFDVYDRIRALQLPLGSFETDVVSLANAGIAGAVYVPQVGIINPSEFAPGNSIEIAIWVSVGGRGTLLGPLSEPSWSTSPRPG